MNREHRGGNTGAMFASSAASDKAADLTKSAAACYTGPTIRWRAYSLLVLLACLIFLPALGRPPLWEPDEGRYAEIAREMVISGDYLNPRDNFVLYFEKPPLVYWLCAASLRVFGVNEFAARLPIALFAIGSVVLTALLAEMIFGLEAGMWAAIAIALSPLFFGFGRSLTLDPPLAFFVTAALVLFFAAFRARNSSRATWLMILSSVMLAFGTLTKGPVAVVLSGGVALAWLIWERKLSFLRSVPWISGALIYFALAAPWFVLVARRNPGFASFFFIHEHLHRYVANTEHGWGPWFFIAVIAGGTWPWLYFLAPQLRRLTAAIGGGASAAQGSAMRFLIVWFAFVVIFFSVPRSKLGSYILPALPPLAAVIGAGLAEIWRNRVRPNLGAMAAVNLLLAAAAVPAMWWIAHSGPIHTVAIDLSLAFGLLLAGSIVAWSIAGRSAKSAPLALTIGVVMALSAALKAREDAHELNSYRELAMKIAPSLHSDCILASYRHFVQALPFYTGQREKLVEYRGELAPFGNEAGGRASFIDTPAELKRTWSGPSCMIMVVNSADFKALAASLSPPPKVLAGEGKKLAITNVR